MAACYPETMNQQNFILKNEYIALCDLLKICGVCNSGGAAKHYIAEGNVSVDGGIELRKTCKIRVGQTVNGDGFEIRVLAA